LRKLIYFSFMKRRMSLYVMAIFYLMAGINHFRNPEGYYQIIPGWLGDPTRVNLISGIAEIALALLLIIPATKKFACYTIILMLIAFVPAHILMIKTGFCVHDLFCLPRWALWARLLVFQPLLIWWAASNSRLQKMNSPGFN